MTRKHPNRRMLISLSAEERAQLRGLARGRSLGDVLRRLVQAGLQGHATEVTAGGADRASRLPLQLPRQARRAVADLAGQRGCTPEVMVLTLMSAALRQRAGGGRGNSQ